MDMEDIKDDILSRDNLESYALVYHTLVAEGPQVFYDLINFRSLFHQGDHAIIQFWFQVFTSCVFVY
jgi:hypothetical protein